MNPIYLTRVRIANFRTYGADFELNLPARPGLTVLNGMNGLGKTGFFEAMEWALTGTVRRLERRLQPNMRLESRLTRQATGVPAGSHRVELAFGEAGSVVRGGPGDQPTADALVALLRRPDWVPVIEDLRAYLRLTHFLPQSSHERYLDQDRERQWELLKGPAGVEHLEKLRTLLGDRKARRAFAEHITALESAEAEARRALDDWDARLLQREALRLTARVSGAIPPTQATEILGELRRQLATLTGKPVPAAASRVPPLERIPALQNALEAHRVNLTEALGKIPTAEQILSEWNLLRDRRAALERQRKLVENASAENMAVETAQAALTRVRSQLTEREQAWRDVQRRADRLRGAIEALTTLNDEIYPALRVAKAVISELDARETALAERSRQHQEKRALRDADMERLRRLRQTLSSLASAEPRITLALEAYRVAERVAAELPARMEAQQTAQVAEATASRTLTDKRAVVAVIRRRLNAAQVTADVVGTAVAQIAQHLSPEDAVCPVCAHTHPPGELRRAALEALERIGAGSGALSEELAGAQRESVAAETALREARQHAKAAAAEVHSIRERREEAETLQREVESRPELPALELMALPGWVAARRGELQSDLDRLLANPVGANDPAPLETEGEELDRAQHDLLAERTGALAVRDGIQRREADLEAVLTVNLAPLAPLSREDISALKSAWDTTLIQINDFEGRVAAHQAEAATAEEKVLAAEVKVTANRETLSRVTRELAQAEVTATALQTAWTGLGLPGEPDGGELTRHRLNLTSSRGKCESLSARLQTTAAGLVAWETHEQLQRLEVELKTQSGDQGQEDGTAHRLRLKTALKDLDVAVRQAKAASERAIEIAGELKFSADAFSDAVLAPLSEKISAFSRLISPFGYRFQVRTRRADTRVRAEPVVLAPARSAGRRSDSEHDPALWLSEGQASALGLCVLFGASTIYRWSRWSALLLDDPLQHTDLIHAAAFIEVVRGLISDEGYQIFLSTHDGQSAEFLARRCARAGLPVTRVDLLGVASDGLRYRIRHTVGTHEEHEES